MDIRAEPMTAGRRFKLLRIAFLALMLVFTGATGPRLMSESTAAASHALHHCHDGNSTSDHHSGSTCPCCDAQGCHCLQGTAAPLPPFAVLPSLAPALGVVMRSTSTFPTPPIAEQLRPPIA